VKVVHHPWAHSPDSYAAGGSDYWTATVLSVEELSTPSAASDHEARLLLWKGREMVLRAGQPRTESSAGSRAESPAGSRADARAVRTLEQRLEAVAGGPAVVEASVREETMPDGGMVQVLVLGAVEEE
jgi:hypothetical protein